MNCDRAMAWAMFVCGGLFMLGLVAIVHGARELLRERLNRLH